MLNPEIANKVIDHALSNGASFCDIFVEKNHASTIQILSSEVNEIQSGIDFGIGIRLVYGTDVVYGYTNSLDQNDLIGLTQNLATLYKDKNSPQAEAIKFKLQSPTDLHPTKLDLDSEVPLDDKVRYYLKVDKWAREESEKIGQVNVRGIQRKQEVEIFNSEGLAIADTRNYIRVGMMVIAQDGAEQQSAFEGPGGLLGWEFTNNFDIKSSVKDVARTALIKLDAKACPGGKLPVIIDNGFGGVIFHEACGHLLETTSVAKKASVFHDKMGEMIASNVLSAVDDGTIKNEWGSINIDDEGMETQKTQLIKDGKLTAFLSDRIGAEKVGVPRSGSARRQNYKFAPASRMRNTYIESGNDSFEDMVQSIEHGIYCKKMGGGSVLPGTGEFNFAADESYLIENGKITDPLKSATLIGKGSEILTKISMISDNLKLTPGMCGSVSGAVPTTVGQPAIKVDEILVGGQS
ncbi:MAG: TldD/PmbA family protein [Bacteriovoracaceae bacterium]